MNYIILFDGMCNLCDKSVQWVIKQDKKKQFLFASLQGETGEKARVQHKMIQIQSVILLEGDKVYTESTAALRICKHLGGVWKLSYGFILIPKPIRDGVYRIIAKNRYKWFGKREVCLLPTPELKSRFLD